MTRALAAIASARLTGQPFAVDSLIRTRRSVPPEVTALARQIASGLPDSDKWAFAADFMTRTHRHGNLAMVWPKWALWLLTEEMRPRAGFVSIGPTISNVFFPCPEFIEGSPSVNSSMTTVEPM